MLHLRSMSFEDIVLPLGSHGSLRGSVDPQNGVIRFLGVPYALPPTGDRRWTTPEPLPADFTFNSIDGQPRDCTKFGPVCPQEIYMLNGEALDPKIADVEYSEDCLNLNIWASPSSLSEQQNLTRPVIVFIHGGWLQSGNPSVTESLQPHELIAPVECGGAGFEAVVVSIGYRLNVFGFLAGDNVNGNFGLWDQREALKWVQRFISCFGGDPGRVTLFGHSAGGFSAHTQLQYELLHTNGSCPLFKRVFLCSNAIAAQPKTRREAHAMLLDLCNVLNLSETKSMNPLTRLSALRLVAADDLIAALPKLKTSSFRAVTDEALIHSDMLSQFRNGTFARAFRDRNYILMTGETETEEFLYSQSLPPKSKEDVPAKLQNYYAADTVERLLAHPKYQMTNSNFRRVFSEIVSDMQVRAPVRALCRELLENKVRKQSLLRYRFSWRPSFFEGIYPPEAGVTHGADLYAWWAGRRFGYTENEWETLRGWLNVSLKRLVQDAEFPLGTDAKNIVQLTSEGQICEKQDSHWESLISVLETISK